MEHEPDQTLELIRTGAAKGREALSWLDEHGAYVYHGSNLRLDKLEPRQAYTLNRELQQRVPDGEPAVCTSKNFEIAIFRALINRHKEAALGKKGHYSRFWSDQGRVGFAAQQDSLDLAHQEGEVG